jgi:hypothetical protein
VRRIALRDLRSDEGLSLVETVVSLLVFALIMSGLAASMAMFAHSTSLSRARATASTMAQQYVEKARAVGATVLDNCDSSTSNSPYPPLSAPYRGAGSFTVVQGHEANCLPYQKPVTQDGIPFTLTRLVLYVTPPSPDVTGQLQTEKYLVVQVSWTDGGGTAKTYELDTIVNQAGSNQAAPAQGVRLLVEDTSGKVVVSDNANWTVSITSTDGATSYTDPTATTAEGAYSQVDLPIGNYICTVTTTDDSSSGYYPASATYNPSPLSMPASNDTVTGPCNVQQTGVVVDFVTKWTTFPDCSTSGTGTLTVSAMESDDQTPVPSNMTLAVTNVTTGTKTTSTAVSHSFTSLAAGWYTYSVVDPGDTWQAAQTSYGPVCVVNKVTQQLNVDMTPQGNCVPGAATKTTALSITVVDSITQTGMQGFKVAAVDTSVTPNTNVAMPNTTASGVSTVSNIKPGLYTYTVTPPNGSSYQGSGIQGPTCVTANVTTTKIVPLSTATCSRNAADKTGSFAFTVVDQLGHAIQNASIKLTNVNGDQTVAAATTDATGKRTFTGLAVDPWQYDVTGPGGNYLDSGPVGPICASHNTLLTVPAVTLTGLMNISVTVTNKDLLPWKNYTITVYSIDPQTGNAGNPVTQNITVPDCGYNGSAACGNNPSPVTTFSGLVTGTYQVQVCTQLKNNCNVVDTAPGDPADTTTYYTFTTPLATYTPSTSGCTPSCGELALTDESGGW